MGGRPRVLAGRGRLRRRGRGPVQPAQPTIRRLADQRRPSRARLVLRGGRCAVRRQRLHPLGRRAVRARPARARAVELAGRTAVRAERRAVRRFGATPSDFVPRCATTRCIADGKVAARASTDGRMVVAHRGTRRLCHQPRRHVDRGPSESRLVGHRPRCPNRCRRRTPALRRRQLPPPDDASPRAPIRTGSAMSLFPALGNPGIDVEHYTLVLDYDPKRRRALGDRAHRSRDDRGSRPRSRSTPTGRT